MRAKGIFVGGTASHVGKSWMATAICRHLSQSGFRVAPFKAQNMSNNSYPCAGGGEIGRAQVAQAEACGLDPTPEMNPILLKPSSDMGSQVVVNGLVWRTLRAREYYENFDFLLGQVLDAYDRLARRYEYLVIEGAGSVAELNLRDRDLVNFGLARRVEAPALLVSDIDRGGVFASIIGTLCLIDPEERDLVRAFAVNRFRGDPSLFQDGVRILENKSGKPCLGVFPMAAEIEVDAEDGVSLEEPVATSMTPALPLRVGILRFPRISNFTDFRLIGGAQWLTAPVEERFDAVILPGTKSTIADLEWTRERGLDGWLDEQHRRGARVIGVCGGYQMLGEQVDDPDAADSERRSAAGLGLLPVRTIMERDKTTRVVEAATPGGVTFSAYEIHMGRTESVAQTEPFATLADGSPEGARHGRVIGTYLHGALEHPGVLAEVLGCPVETPSPKAIHYDRLAEWFRQNANVAAFEERYL